MFLKMNTNNLSSLLVQTLNPQLQKSAEKQLFSLESDPELPFKLLLLIHQGDAELSVRLAAAIFLKNFIKKFWIREDSVLNEEKKSQFRTVIIDAMISSHPNIQIHLADIISIIATEDFPHQWKSLLPILVSKLNANDYHINNGVLKAAHAIFKKYRNAFRTDELFTEINEVLLNFADPLLQLYKTTDMHIDSLEKNQAALNILFSSLFLLNKIFYSLSYQDIPAFFEDHLSEFMSVIRKYLTYSSSLLVSESEEEPGILEKVQTSICEIVHLYAQRYEEEFPMLPEFVSTILHLLATTSLSPKYDTLISMALSVINVIVKRPQYHSYFDTVDTLKIVCEKIIITNIMLRDSDEDIFESEPLDFVRRDLEGSETDSRKKAAEDLARCLVQMHKHLMNPLLLHYIDYCIKEYNTNRRQKWKMKDAAINLFMALCIKTYTATKGATSLHGGIDCNDFFKNSILNELHQTSENDTHPLLICTAIKYCLALRYYLEKDLLLSILPAISNLLTHKHTAVFTYSAIFFDRILSTKIGGEFIVPFGNVSILSEKLAVNLFGLIINPRSVKKINENEFILKTILRIILIVKNHLEPLWKLFLGELVFILNEIAENPCNPRFYYYLFESIGFLIVNIYPKVPINIQNDMQELILPVFQKILQNDLQELVPYVLLISSLMIEHFESNSAPPQMLFLFDPILQSSIWSNTANTTSLVRLLEAFILKHSSLLVDNSSYLESILGIVQNLLSSRLYDHYGFDIFKILLMRVPISRLEKYMTPLTLRILKKAEGNKSIKFNKLFCLLICHLICFSITEEPVTYLMQLLESIQPGLFGMIIGSFVIASNVGIFDERERKILATAIVKLLNEKKILISHQQLWSQLMEILVIVQTYSSSPKQSDISEELDSFGIEDEGQVSSLSGHSIRLKATSYNLVNFDTDKLPITDAFLANMLMNLKNEQIVALINANCSDQVLEFIKMIAIKMNLDIF